MSESIMDDPNIALKESLIEEYLNEQGYSVEKLHHLPERVVKQLMKEANRYATLKIEEIESKAHFVNELLGGTRSHNE